MSFENTLINIDASEVLNQSDLFKDSGVDPSQRSIAGWEHILRDIFTKQEHTSLDSNTQAALNQWADANKAPNLTRALREFNERFNLAHEKASLELIEELESGDVNEEVPNALRGMLEELVPLKREYDELKEEHDELRDRLKEDPDADVYYDEFLLKNDDRMRELRDELSKKMYIIDRLQEEFDWIDGLEDIKNEVRQEFGVHF